MNTPNNRALPAKMIRTLIPPGASVNAYALVEADDLSKAVDLDVPPAVAAVRLRERNPSAATLSDDELLSSPAGVLIAIPMLVWRQKLVLMFSNDVAGARLFQDFGSVVHYRAARGVFSVVAKSGEPGQFTICWKAVDGKSAHLSSFWTVSEMIDAALNPQVLEEEPRAPDDFTIELFDCLAVWHVDDFIDCYLRRASRAADPESREQALKFQRRYADLIGVFVS